MDELGNELKMPKLKEDKEDIIVANEVKTTDNLDLTDANNTSVVENVILENNNISNKEIEHPMVEQPIIVQPITEQPMTTQPIAEQPVVEVIESNTSKEKLNNENVQSESKMGFKEIAVLCIMACILGALIFYIFG